MENLQGQTNYSDFDKTHFFKIRKTVLKMLEDRGYTITQEDKDKTLEQWINNFKVENLCFLANKKNDSSDFIYIEFNSALKLGVGDVENFVKRLHSQGVRNGIIILKGGITSMAKQVSLYYLNFDNK
jgi:hypothetical protein